MVVYINRDNKSKIQEVKNFIKTYRAVGLDLETEGLDPYTSKIITYQIGNDDVQYVINHSDVPITEIKEELENEEHTFIGHNIKFDLKFILHQRIVVKKVFDTYVTEQILTNGLDYKYPHRSLDYVCKRYTGVMLDKSVRGLIRRGITDTVIKYAADDVKYLNTIASKQIQEAEKLDLTLAIKLNNAFVPVIAYLEYSGFKLDTKRWMEKVNKDKKELEEQQKALDQYIIENNIKEFIDPQLNLWDTELRTLINWNSSQQVIKLFKKVGINTEIDDLETGGKKDTVEASHIKKSQHPLALLYIKYKELQKRVSTYGENWLEFISPVTGRIHTKFQQWMSTGRMSSGGKEGKLHFPNAQNIPSDEDTRRCIVAEEGNILIDADYDSQEVRVFTNFCQDPALVKMFKEGFKDMHSYTAWHLFPEIRKEIPELTVDSLKEVKEKFPKQRQISKLGNFAIQYGGTGYTVAENCNIPLEEGEYFYNQYFKTFKGVNNYFKWIFNKSKERGYIQYNNFTKEKFFIPPGLKDNKLKNYCYNYPIQGTSAAITKLAGILYWNHLVKENLVFKVKIAIICHDEYLIEVPKELAEQEALALKKCMEEAGSYYCETVPLTATPVITEHWKH